MIKEVIMPKLGETVEEAIVEKWHKKEGDKVKKGEVLLEATTDKATLEVESFHEGFLRKILAEEGKSVPVLTIIGYVSDSIEEEIPTKIPIIEKSEKEVSESEKEETQPKVFQTPSIIKASPLAKKLARELNIDLSKIKGTGPGERITREDVLTFQKEEAQVKNVEGEEIPLSSMRKGIIESMTKSKREIPHYYLTTEINMTECINLRKGLLGEFEKKGFPKPAYDDMLIKATSIGLKKYPNMRRILKENSLKILETVNIGLAVSLEDGLIVPVINSADDLSLEEITKKRDDLVSRARSKKLNPDETKGASLIISNLGMYEVTGFIAVIPPTANSILAVGRIREIPVVKDGKITASPVIQISGSFDHRVIDGAYAALFLQEVKRILEEASILLDQ